MHATSSLFLFRFYTKPFNAFSIIFCLSIIIFREKIFLNVASNNHSAENARGCGTEETTTTTTTTTHPREVHPGAEPTLVATHDRRRLGSTLFSSETVLSSMEKRSMDRRKQWPTRVLTATVAFFSTDERPSYYSPIKHIFFRSFENRIEFLKYYFFRKLRGENIKLRCSTSNSYNITYMYVVRQCRG